MTYQLNDLKQVLIGSFISIIVFFAIRGGNPFFFNPKIGLGITVVLFYIYYNGFKMKNKMQHFIINIGIAFTVSAIMAVVFGLITKDEVLTFKVFGSLAIIGLWIAFPAAMLYDKFEIMNPMRRKYVRGK